MSNESPQFALRLYVDGEATSSLLCDFGSAFQCPQWHWSQEHRMTWPSAEAAKAYRDALDALFPDCGFAPEPDRDIRVVRVIPPVPEQFVDVVAAETSLSPAATRETYLLTHIAEQIEKRQYLNATFAAQELSQKLLQAFNAVLKNEDRP